MFCTTACVSVLVTVPIGDDAETETVLGHVQNMQSPRLKSPPRFDLCWSHQDISMGTVAAALAIGLLFFLVSLYHPVRSPHRLRDGVGVGVTVLGFEAKPAPRSCTEDSSETKVPGVACPFVHDRIVHTGTQAPSKVLGPWESNFRMLAFRVRPQL
ncbi:unnamed protein product [Ostreobium quekettii]|uniref:Uncharacterized protein n=1 Tax=Ostreobium quekettii TaxID=121088 RepID=A0A8S1IUX8_9CHLO|nr:unnamed protein product [Ostreobium quekettii]